MTTHLRMHHRLVGAIVGGWLALEISVLTEIAYLFLAVPLVAALGATSYAQRFARPALALTGGLMAGLLVSATAGILGVSLVLALLPSLLTLFAVTAVLWSVQSAEGDTASLSIVAAKAKRSS